MKTETELTLQEILELLRKEIDIYNATNLEDKGSKISQNDDSIHGTISDNCCRKHRIRSIKC